jgi:electron transfer flavoprotein alpha subunit
MDASAIRIGMTAALPRLIMPPIANQNTVETMRGHPLAERVLARQAELEAALINIESGQSVEAIAIETALASLAQLLTGDVDHPASMVAHDLNNWLERNRYLGLSATQVARRRARAKAHAH